MSTRETIYKVRTWDARFAEVYEYTNGTRVARTRVPLAEYRHYALHERARLIDLAGTDVLARHDAELSAELGEHSFYLLKPLTTNDFT